jgi:hypothetical protein
MKFVDDSQNLRVRLHVIQVFILVLLGVLCLRLYGCKSSTANGTLKVAEMAPFVSCVNATGVIFDRMANSGRLAADL